MYRGDHNTPAVLRPNLPNCLSIPLSAGATHIGRAAFGENDIAIAPDDSLASRQHAVLYLRDDAWFLEDMSSNGTYVSNQLLSNRVIQLHQGDSIRIGRTFHYTFWDLGSTEDAMAGSINMRTNDSAPVEQPSHQPDAAPRDGIWLGPSGAVYRDGVIVAESLSPTEHQLLTFLSARPGQLCDYATVSKAVWGDIRGSSSMHELVFRLRRKIEIDPSAPRYLIMRPKLGVIFFQRGEQIMLGR